MRHSIGARGAWALVLVGEVLRLDSLLVWSTAPYDGPAVAMRAAEALD